MSSTTETGKPFKADMEEHKMAYKVKVTVIDKKLYPELQQQYCAVPGYL